MELPPTQTPDNRIDNASDAAGTVRRRHVFYAYGFDPASVARYRRLIMAAGEGKASPLRSMSDVSVGWTVDAAGVETTFEVLAYEDIVQRFRARPAVPRLLAGFRAWLGFAASGGVGRAHRLCSGPVRLWAYPFLMFCIFLGVGIGIAVVPALAFGFPLGGFGTIIGGGLLAYWLSKWAEKAVFAHLMLALFEFMFRLARGGEWANEMDTRLDAFAARIAAAPDASDEVLVVGHSLGGWVAVRALARALPAMRNRRINLLTLGSVAGFVACRGGRGADAYLDDVATIATAPAVFWTDVSAPRDWFSFGLVDPLLMVPNPPPKVQSPRVISAKFGKFHPDPADWRTRFQPMGLHMKYLSAPALEGGFDPFATMCGTETLATRYGPRRNSPKAKMHT